jgi:hypothetical protein
MPGRASETYLNPADTLLHSWCLQLSGRLRRIDQQTKNLPFLPSIELSRAVWVPTYRKTGLVLLPASRFLPRDLFTFFPGLREPDRYCLLPAFDLATLSSSPAFRSATLVTSHLTFDVATGAARIFPLSFLSHSLPLDLCKNCTNRAEAAWTLMPMRENLHTPGGREQGTLIRTTI